MNELYKEYFKFPLEMREGSIKVLTADGCMAFDFVYYKYMSNKLRNEAQGNLLKILNGDASSTFESSFKFTHNGAEILLDGITFAYIRSWGRLTGRGRCGLGLSDTQVAEIQSCFAKHLVDTWNNHSVKNQTK